LVSDTVLCPRVGQYEGFFGYHTYFFVSHSDSADELQASRTDSRCTSASEEPWLVAMMTLGRHPRDAHDAQRHLHQHQSDSLTHAV
jgi:hypothetical protein